MVNRILYSLSNRASGFASPIFPYAVPYTPTVASSEVEVLRNALRINDARDYYLVAMLAVVDSFPSIRNAFGDDTRTYDLAEYRRPPASIAGCQWLPGPDGAAGILRQATEFPVQFDLTISYKTANVATLRLGSQVWDVPVRLSGGVLYVPWPPELGVKGLLQFNEWTSGAVATITHTPVSYPFTAACALLESLQEHWDVLLRQGLVELYYNAATPEEKLALTCLAIGKSTIQ